MRKPDTTGRRIASIAARIFGADGVSDLFLINGNRETRVSGADVRSCMASLVNQSPSHSPDEREKSKKTIRKARSPSASRVKVGEWIPRKIEFRKKRGKRG